MKKQMLGMMLMAASTLLFSCQKQIETTQDEPQAKGPNRSLTKTAAAYTTSACETYCIDPANPEYYYLQGEITGTVGGNPKSYTYKMWNDLSNFYVEVTFRRGPNNSGATSTVKVTVNGADQSVILNNQNKFATSQTRLLTFSLPIGWKACDAINWALLETAGDGPALTYSSSYNLIGQCIPQRECEEAFNYTAVGPNTYTFTYTPAEDKAGAVLTLTFPQSDIVAVTGLQDWTVPGNGNAQVFKKTVDLSACEPISWTVGLSPNCGGIGQQGANLWTDFTVDGVSKKGSLSNIRSNCQQ